VYTYTCKETEASKKAMMAERNAMKYELVIIWSNGDKNVYQYHTREEAEIGERNMRMANGNQIAWSGVRRA